MAGPDAAASEREAAWVHNQRALARIFGVSIEEWIQLLDAASKRQTGLTAAVIGAATAKGLGLGVLDQLDGAKLAARARALLDPAPPSRIKNPLLREAVRRSEELTAGRGRERLKRKQKPVARPEIEAPRRVSPKLPSAGQSTPDAPGEDES